MDKRREEGIRDDGGDDEVVVIVVVEERGDGGIARWRKTEGYLENSLRVLFQALQDYLILAPHC
jgi:hypothetical protein